MGSNSIVSNRWMSEKMNCLDLSPNSNSDNEEEEVHVLAVDDSLVDRKVIERLLKISSCKVTAVDSGWGALKLLGLLDDDEEDKSSSSSSSSSSAGFEGLKVDLIITDYCMPGMTGYELLKKIKESSSFREIPVVIMSSENVMARIDRCLEEGAEEFIAKPVKLSDVKRLRDYYMATREIRSIQSSSNVNKRKLQESFDVSTSSSPPSISPSLSPSSASPPSLFSSPAPCSPSSLDSPTRRIRMTSFD